MVQASDSFHHTLIYPWKINPIHSSCFTWNLCGSLPLTCIILTWPSEYFRLQLKTLWPISFFVATPCLERSKNSIHLDCKSSRPTLQSLVQQLVGLWGIRPPNGPSPLGPHGVILGRQRMKNVGSKLHQQLCCTHSFRNFITSWKHSLLVCSMLSDLYFPFIIHTYNIISYHIIALINL